MKKAKGAATRTEMGSLHDELAKRLTDVIKNGEEVTRGEDTFKVPASAAMLNVARGFLKDNNVECDENLPTRQIGELSNAVNAALTKMEEDDELPEFTN
jgi:hypothetical protein